MSINAVQLSKFNADYEKKYFLVVNSCGIGINENTKKDFFLRPNGTKDYQIIINMQGSVDIKIFDEQLALYDNEIIIIPPNKRHEYRYNPGSYTIFIHFSGQQAEKLLKSYRLDVFKKYKISSSKALVRISEKIITEMETKNVGFINNCAAYLIQFITEIKRETDGLDKQNSNKVILKIHNVADDMKINYQNSKNINDYAALCDISSYRFIHLFTEIYGTSPHNYLINIRIQKASYLLSQTNIPISDIAQHVGYDDQFYFSRLFKKHTGKSPSQFRKESK